MIWLNADPLSGSCGIDNLHSFYTKYGNDELRHINKAGSGLYIANFIDRVDCKLAYIALCEKFKLLYQSPVRLNHHSGNYGFFCVFGDKDRY